MKKLNSKGFGVIEGIMVLAIIGIIGGAGYYVYKQNKDISSQQSRQSAASAENEQNDVYANWYDYSFEAGGYNVKHPKDWKVDTGGEGDETGTLVHLISPKFKTTNGDGNEVAGQLRINLFSGPVYEGESAGEGKPWVGTGGEVIKVTPINNNLKLIWHGYPEEQVTVVVNDVADVKIGDKRYQEGFIKNNKNLSISVSFDDLTTSKENGSGSGLLSKQWESLSEYRTTVEILNTLSFN